MTSNQFPSTYNQIPKSGISYHSLTLAIQKVGKEYALPHTCGHHFAMQRRSAQEIPSEFPPQAAIASATIHKQSLWNPTTIPRAFAHSQLHDTSRASRLPLARLVYHSGLPVAQSPNQDLNQQIQHKSRILRSVFHKIKWNYHSSVKTTAKATRAHLAFQDS